MIALADALTALRMFERSEGIKAIVRDLGMLESSLTRAAMTSYGVELYPGIHLKMAATLDSINRNHPLVDGNKRLSWIVVAATYRVNGFGGPRSSVDQLEALVLSIADQHPELEWIADQLAQEFTEVRR